MNITLKSGLVMGLVVGVGSQVPWLFYLLA